jgi:branched-chain amino acid transport system permease protein
MLKRQVTEWLDWHLLLRILNWRLILIVAVAYYLYSLSNPEWIVQRDKPRFLIELFTLASLAASWNILAGFVGHINLGHVAFFGIGSAVTRELWLTKEYSLYHAFFIGGGAAALAALVVGSLTLRLRGTYFAIATLAMAEAVRLAIQTWLPGQSTLPVAMLRTFRTEYIQRYELCLYVLVATVLVSYVLSRSRFGLAMRAIREDEDAARSIGIDVFLHSIFAFVLSAFFAGLAGGAFAYSEITYQHSLAFEPKWTFNAVLVTFIGGPGTIIGPILGSGFFIYSRDYLSGTAQLVDTHPIIFGVLFIIVVLILPGGMVDLSTRISKWVLRLPTQFPSIIRATRLWFNKKSPIN